MRKISRAESGIDLVNPARLGVCLGLLIASLADPVDFQIQARILGIDSPKDFELAQCLDILAAVFQVIDFLFDCSYQIAALGDFIEAFPEVRFFGVKVLGFRQDGDFAIKVRLRFHVMVDFEDI